ncbi:MAG TPA: phosphoribosylanthranilate isomerase, partial [Tepidisphaeraceae bacterium]|nr:phosphoribosylanthranilate isomerase [Tepidisphaeraceae bacterium]
IGLNFYPKTKRCIDVKTAHEIVAVLPPLVTPVGLFVDASVDEIRRVADELGLSHVQLHGQESPEVVAQLSSYTILKSVIADRSTLAEEIARWKTARLIHLKGLLLETPHTGHAGGSGIENDWAAIAEFAQSGLFKGAPPIIAAGGLNENNVASVIRLLHPYAVDVSSGVETAPGQKSAPKIKAFVDAVRSADRSH